MGIKFCRLLLVTGGDTDFNPWERFWISSEEEEEED
jgi:hypothetical protein